MIQIRGSISDNYFLNSQLNKIIPLMWEYVCECDCVVCVCIYTECDKGKAGVIYTARANGRFWRREKIWNMTSARSLGGLWAEAESKMWQTGIVYASYICFLDLTMENFKGMQDKETNIIYPCLPGFNKYQFMANLIILYPKLLFLHYQMIYKHISESCNFICEYFSIMLLVFFVAFSLFNKSFKK